jgi:hypothetical protein
MTMFGVAVMVAIACFLTVTFIRAWYGSAISEKLHREGKFIQIACLIVALVYALVIAFNLLCSSGP